jgi:hypothetical protein
MEADVALRCGGVDVRCNVAKTHRHVGSSSVSVGR